MTAVFADASFYVAVLSPRDLWHRAAKTFGEAYRGDVVTTEFVLSEVANFLAEAHRRPRFTALLSALRADPQVEAVSASPQW